MFIDEFIVWSWRNRPDIRRIGLIVLGMFLAAILVAALFSGSIFVVGFALTPALIIGAITLVPTLICVILAVANLTYKPTAEEIAYKDEIKQTWRQWFASHSILIGAGILTPILAYFSPTGAGVLAAGAVGYHVYKYHDIAFAVMALGFMAIAALAFIGIISSTLVFLLVLAFVLPLTFLAGRQIEVLIASYANRLEPGSFEMVAFNSDADAAMDREVFLNDAVEVPPDDLSDSAVEVAGKDKLDPQQAAALEASLLSESAQVPGNDSKGAYASGEGLDPVAQALFTSVNNAEQVANAQELDRQQAEALQASVERGKVAGKDPSGDFERGADLSAQGQQLLQSFDASGAQVPRPTAESVMGQFETADIRGKKEEESQSLEVKGKVAPHIMVDSYRNEPAEKGAASSSSTSAPAQSPGVGLNIMESYSPVRHPQHPPVTSTVVQPQTDTHGKNAGSHSSVAVGTDTHNKTTVTTSSGG